MTYIQMRKRGLAEVEVVAAVAILAAAGAFEVATNLCRVTKLAAGAMFATSVSAVPVAALACRS